MPIKHSKVSTIVDGPNPLQVQPTSDWNADHPLVIPGSIFAGVTGDSGYEPFPAYMGEAQWEIVTTDGGTGLIGIGTAAPSVVGTGTAATFATTSRATRQKRTDWLSASVANSAVGARITGSFFAHRSTTAGRGGWFNYHRIVLGANMGSASGRLFVGMRSDSGTLTQAPSTLTGDFIGIGYDEGDTHLKLMSRDNVTTQNLDLGATVPKTDGLMYDVYLYCPPGGAAVYYRIDLHNGNVLTQRIIDTSTTTNLPRTDIGLGCKCQGGTSSTTPVTMGIAKFGTIWQTNS